MIFISCSNDNIRTASIYNFTGNITIIKSAVNSVYDKLSVLYSYRSAKIKNIAYIAKILEINNYETFRLDNINFIIN